MTVISSSLLPSLPYLCPPRSRSNRFSNFGNCPRCVPTRVSFQFQQLGQTNLPTLRATGTGSLQVVDRKRVTLGSKGRNSVFSCNAALNARCSQGQTQTITREAQAPTISKAPVHGKEGSPKLDDGGSGFPPRYDGGGGGGGGGGGENFSGGFFLFGFLLFLGFLKDLESEHDHRSGHGR